VTTLNVPDPPTEGGASRSDEAAKPTQSKIMNATERPTELAAVPLFALTFRQLYAIANNVTDRLNLLRLAKCHHIEAQEFEEAMKYRELERQLQGEVDAAVKSVGADLLANA
jgi:hypothetical protein